MSAVLDQFSPATREWFVGAFPAPTAAQLGAWEAIAGGSHTLVVAPTGSGKTLSAFLWALDQLATAPPVPAKRKTRVVYVSPLKALAVDVERNLRAPLVGIIQTAKRLGLAAPDITVGVRSGDTTPAGRRSLLANPPDILITTPESLYLMLTSAARETLTEVQTVIVDEVHAVAGTKRGSHLALSLERLDIQLRSPAQRIGLSATVRPHEEVARFLAGSAPTTIVAPPSAKAFALSVRVPVEDMANLPPGVPAEGSIAGVPAEGSIAGVPAAGSIWPHVEEKVVDLVLEHRSSIVFANSRRLAERLTARLNEIYAERTDPGRIDRTDTRPPALVMAQSDRSYGADPLLARAHHGSVSKEQRALIEDDLKSGRLRCVVATSSLELGIDMGAVDLVIQVESPPSVASALQRVGRAGHQVGEVSRGILFPKHRADLVHCTVTVERMVAGQIEALSVPANPLDVLAQQTVAAAALEPIDADEWFDAVRRTGSFAALPRSAYHATLDLLSGKYPSDEFAELRPRLVWDRDRGTLTGRPGAQRLAVTSGGTIPDRGLFGVFMVGEKTTRVGELDEEMVYESRVGDVFALGATSWRIEDITHDRVLVSPAFGQPGRLPFWIGDNLGRPAELGRALGSFLRDVASADPAVSRARFQRDGLDEYAADNVLAFLDEQKQATNRIPDDQTMVVERFRDELGDWRVILHSPFGTPVNAPWALAVTARLRERLGIDGGAVSNDDGIVVRIPDTDDDPPGAELFAFDSDEIDALVTTEVGGSALFAARFRECAARALLLPRRNPGRRAPLWQQRQRSAQLLEVARKYPTFPIILEAVRECLQDVYDLPSLTEIMRSIERRQIRVVEVETQSPSPFARSLLFGYVAAFMYEGDSPLAERRAAALALDSTLLAELLGRVELRELLDASVLEQTQLELQHRTDERRIKDLEGAADLLRLLGPLTIDELAERTRDDCAAMVPGWLTELESAHRALTVSFAGNQWWVAIEDASRLRDALGVPLPIGTPTAFIEPVSDPLGDLIGRFARTHAPFTTAAAAARFGLGTAVVLQTLRRLASEGRAVEGEFSPGAQGSEWCDAEVLRRLRRRSLAALRQEVEPVSTATLGRFLPAWQHVGGSLSGIDGVATVIDQLAGVPIPASAWEPLILSPRIRGYSPAMLDELTSTGEVIWSGTGSISGKDGWVSLHLADTAPLTLALPDEFEPTELQQQILGALAGGGAFFFRQLADALAARDGESGGAGPGGAGPRGAGPDAAKTGAAGPTDATLAAALWELVWAGRVTGDTFAPLRALLTGAGSMSRSGTPSHRTRRSAPRLHSYRGARPSMATRTGPPSVAGRWSLAPEPDTDPTRRAHAVADQLLERYGVVTRGSVVNEEVPGGFALVYKVLSTFEESGRCRRGYFIDSLGAAQFSTAATVDRLRSYSEGLDDRATPGDPIALAATDPANPYGAALAWPPVFGVDGESPGHRPGRKAGALVVLIGGELTIYLERGGKTMLTFTDDLAVLSRAAGALAGLVRTGGVDSLVIEKVNGEPIWGTDPARVLEEAGFAATPRGFRLRTTMRS